MMHHARARDGHGMQYAAMTMSTRQQDRVDKQLLLRDDEQSSSTARERTNITSHHIHISTIHSQSMVQINNWVMTCVAVRTTTRSTLND